MASLRNLIGGYSLICEGKLDFGSFCIQRTIIDVVNLVFLFVFYLLCLYVLSENSTVELLTGRTISPLFLAWLVELDRGLIWISLSVSLLVRTTKPVKILVFAWWVSFALLVSVLHIEVLFRTHRIEIFDVVPWPVNILLLFCAFRNFIDLSKENESLSEPLLEEKEEKEQIELCETNFFNKLSFSWINPLLSRGYLRPLTLEDIPSISTEDESNVAYQKFAYAWESLTRDKSSNDGRNLVLRAITKVYFKENIFIAICAVFRTASVAALPLLLYAFVSYSNQEEGNLLEGLVLLGCLIVSKVVESLSQRYWFFASRRSGMRMRSALMVAVYQKQLKLSSLGRRRHSAGEIVNYIAVDAYRMGEFPWWFHLTWSLVLQLFMSIGMLFSVVGVGAIPGIVPLVVCGFLNMPLAKIIQKFQSQFMISQDERLRATSEILNSMKIIKLQSWEAKFKGLIESLRGNEFKWLSKQQFVRPYGTVFYWISPTIVSSVVFMGCVLLRSAPLNAGIIFTVLATLRTMAEPVRMLPEALAILIQVKVSFDRINAFLLDDELGNDEVRRFPLQNSDKSVIVEAGNFSWVPEIASPTLRNVELEIKRGQKIAVCGPVGAGKSSILYAMLGEIPKLSGTVHMFGSIAYVSQVSWIQSGTIRENILYGNPMDADKYDKAIKACALDKDINSFDHGDLTEIGQRGINMSGGQKQRIQLARAVYNDADIYLLDDPFSADCVMKALENKTVILVTHQVEFLSEVDRILVMDGGQITQSGSYEELLMAGTAFEQVVNAHRDSITALGSWNDEGRGESQGISPEMSNVCYPTKQNSEGEISVKGPSGIQLTQDEETEIGDVGWKPFMDYVSISKGSVYLSLSILTQSTFVVLQAASTYWLAFAIQMPNMTNSMLIGVYTGIATLSAVFVFFRSHYAAHLGLKASKAFFSSLNNAIFKAPMLFFDSTPVGRILTRASSDMSILDFDIPFGIIFMAAGATEVMATIGIMASITWQVLIVAVLAMVAVYYIQGYYMSSARELIRINGTTKAPVMNYAAETSLGVVTIRAFNMVDRFFKNYQKLVDKDATLFFLSNAAMEWLVLRIEALQNLTLFTAAFLLLLLPKNQVTPGLVGLSLSYSLTLTGTQIFTSRWYCSLSNYLISVERIKQFMYIPEEPPAIIEDNRPPSSWPSKGRIELQELKIRYRSNAPLVLKGISCIFKEGTRVGVVGRTGSGKTTLISALFRLVEPATNSIRGSIRTNLDPLGLYSDDEIWKALEKCQLKTTISGLPNKLDSSVSDEGENWSLGQRQLFCLGRVLLKRNRILVLDEATASIDSATDAILQRIIREEFSNCTVITVAHRVPTVLDSDMVMVNCWNTMSPRT
ncbi:ABC transporter C family member 8 [Hibiscus syriacus]|uniref:ABC-type xenobiotic transporter n=1 Tax=Hibiscus syriacus TaxID=106335 RepID=A0A6A2YN44_HIBSY|nr:ABC transporter C family member 8 [Hibiscus syriacus]